MPFLFALTERGLGHIPEDFASSPIFSDSPTSTSYLPLSHFDHYESHMSTTSTIIPAVPTEDMVAVQDDIMTGHDDVMAVQDDLMQPTEKTIDDTVRDTDFPIVDTIETLSSEPPTDDLIDTKVEEPPTDDLMGTQVEEPHTDDLIDTKVEELPIDDLIGTKVEEPSTDYLIDTQVEEPPTDDIIDTKVEEPPTDYLIDTKVDSFEIKESDNIEHSVNIMPSSVEIEDIGQADVQEVDVAAQLEELHRLKSSSYEDIYRETEFLPEKPGPPPDEPEVGDRFTTKHQEEAFGLDGNGKSSSFENVYVESTKEAGDIEEKDIDEYEKVKREVEADMEHDEKGATENEKDVVESEEQDLEEAEQYDKFELGDTSFEATQQERVDSPPKPEQYTKYQAPIDVTYESGLDHIGEGEQTIEGKEILGRSLSCDADAEHAQDSASSSPRQRHYSSPDETMHHPGIDVEQTPPKGIKHL